MNVNVNLMEENVIQVNGGITIGEKMYVFSQLHENGKYLASIMNKQKHVETMKKQKHFLRILMKKYNL